MDVSATVTSDHLNFACPSCSTPYSWNTALPTAQQTSFSVDCEKCGVAFSVRNPGIGTATSPLVPITQNRFCSRCGTKLEPGRAFCSSCGASVTGAAASELKTKLAATSGDALATVRSLAVDPVGSLARAYEALGQERAQATGIALAVLFSLASTIGIALGAKRWMGGLVSLGGGPSYGAYFKLGLALLIFPAALTAISYGVRQVLRAERSIASDLFACGSAVVPLAIAVLLSGMLGVANVEVVALLMLFSTTYLVLMLFTGLTRLGGLTERAAAPAVPIILVLTAWLSKVVFTALM
jgi:hypothetical protein